MNRSGNGETGEWEQLGGPAAQGIRPASLYDVARRAGYLGTDGKPATRDQLMELCRDLLIVLGEDPDRPGLVDTPRRWADWWLEFTRYDPGTIDTTFEQVASDQLVIVGPMRVWSLCEHHLLPFWCDVTVAYIAGAEVLGLSKFARIAHKYAHRLQLQEQLTAQIADEVEQVTGSADVMVIGQGEHLCMSMRGIKTPATMTSSVVRGKFRDLAPLRAETLALLGRR